jgi:hypothetical protein
VETAARQMFSAHSVWPCAADRSVSAVHLAQPCRTLLEVYTRAAELTLQRTRFRSGVSDQPMSVDETSAPHAFLHYLYDFCKSYR